MGRYKVDIPDELWREARSEAIRENMTISQYIERLISVWTGKENHGPETDNKAARKK